MVWWPCLIQRYSPNLINSNPLFFQWKNLKHFSWLSFHSNHEPSQILFSCKNKPEVRKFLLCRNPFLKQVVEMTERSKVQCLLTLMCRQKVRRRLRDQQAGISGLSKQRYQLWTRPVFHRIPVNIQRRSTPSINFSSLSSSKITGTSTIGNSLILETWKQSSRNWSFQPYPILQHSRNSSPW